MQGTPDYEDGLYLPFLGGKNNMQPRLTPWLLFFFKNYINWFYSDNKELTAINN